MLVCVQAKASRFRSIHGHSLVVDKGVKESDGIGAPTHAGQNRIRQLAASQVRILFLGFLTDDGLEITDDFWEGGGT